MLTIQNCQGTLQKAVKAYGDEKQMNMAVEEMAELIVEINHLRRGRSTVFKMCEEVADVMIMMEQLKIIVQRLMNEHGDNQQYFQKVVDYKLKRLKERVHSIDEELIR